MAREVRIYPIDLETDIAIGVKLNTSNPAGRMPGRIFDLSYTTLEQAKTNLFCLLLTNEGERVMHPDFGCNLNKLLFNPITKDIPATVSSTIRSKVGRWLPYLNLTKIDVKLNEDEHLVMIHIEFSLQGNVFDTDSIEFRLNLPL